jgi:hypothetical protein
MKKERKKNRKKERHEQTIQDGMKQTKQNKKE